MHSSERPLCLGLLFGGRSGEHEISLRSARSVVDAIDPARFRLTLIGIDRAGGWHLLDLDAFRRLTDGRFPALEAAPSQVVLPPAPTGGRILDLARPGAVLAQLDVVFPVLHGPYGEDGTVQGLLELAGVPYVGAGVLGSAIGMDKDVQKRLLREAGLPVVDFVTLTRAAWSRDPDGIRSHVAALGWPVFVKPANLGSSVGISKVAGPGPLAAAIETALAYDTKAVVERAVTAREIELAVLGNDAPAVSIPGEIRPRHEFYSYAAKYVDEQGADLLVPAPLAPDRIAAARDLALRTFVALECRGMARVDLFLEEATGRFYVNEINTLPGFTSISMYPNLWEASGIPYRELVGRLVTLALEHHAERARLRTRYAPA